MRILLIGANGQLGTDLAAALPQAGHEVTGATRMSLDVRDFSQIRTVITDIKPQLVINTAAFHNVELCEEDPEEAMLVNGAAVGHLAKVCAESGSVLLHFSTDFVFDGHKRAPYIETDVPNALSVYARSKLNGEGQIQKALEKYFIVRTSGLYGRAGSKSRSGNFVEKILQHSRSDAKVCIVSDQVVAPTYTRDLAQALTRLVATKAYGLYHVTNEGQCSWHEFGQEVLRLSGSNIIAEPVSGSEFKTKVKRPEYSVLSNRKLYALGIPRLPHWKDALSAYLASRAQTLS